MVTLSVRFARDFLITIINQAYHAHTETSVAGAMSAPVVPDASISARTSAGSKVVSDGPAVLNISAHCVAASMHPPVSPGPPSA